MGPAMSPESSFAAPMARVGLSPSAASCAMAPSGFLLQPSAASALAIRGQYGCACPGLRLVQRHKYQHIHWSRRHEDRD